MKRRDLANLRFRLSAALATMPGLYFAVERARQRRPENLVTPQTEITIEGFPRSGNSFAHRAFLSANPHARIAHHKHAAAQLLLSARLKIPALLIIRPPEDSVRSLVVRRPELSAETVLRAWLRFHRTIEPVTGALCIETFDEVTRDFGAVTARLNRQFGTNFECFRHTPENTARVFAEMDAANRAAFGQLKNTHVPHPSAQREELKRRVQVNRDSTSLQASKELFARLSSRSPNP